MKNAKREGASQNDCPRLLILSGDQSVVEPFKLAVRRSGGRLSCATTTSRGLASTLRLRYDAVVVDLEVQDAIAFITSILVNYADRVSVVFACTSSAQQRADALKAGATYVLPKPLNVEVALLAISLVAQPRYP